MNGTVLIDAIVRQTTVLIAQLATGIGGRATLAHTANQVFTSLVRELREQGVSNKGIADMFGLTLRTYHSKVSRLSESSTDRGRPLWEALLGYIERSGSVRRADILSRYSTDDDRLVRGVLRELVDSGLVFRSGSGDGTFYRAARPDEMPGGDRADDGDRLARLLWVGIKRFGPVRHHELSNLVPAETSEIDRALTRLMEEGHVQKHGTEPAATYSAEEVVITAEDPAGWEAAVFDHYQALVTTVTAKLRTRTAETAERDWIGGSTYSYDVWPGHPSFDETVSFLKATRERALSLRNRIERHNATHSAPSGEPLKVLVYFGQTVLGLDNNDF